MEKLKLAAVALPVAFLMACASAPGGGSGAASPSAPSAASGAAATDDAAVTARVKAALAAEPELAQSKITVSTEQGRVKLKGEIKTLVLRKKAQSISEGVSGVKSVDNQLIITG